MYGGYAVRIQLLLRVIYQLLYLFVGRRRYHHAVDAYGGLAQYAGLVIYAYAHFVAELQLFYCLERNAVAGGDVYAGAHGKYGYFGRYAVKVSLGQQAAFLHNFLIPAHAYNACRMLLFDALTQHGYHIVYGVRTEEHHVAAERGVVEHMHMSIVEAGQQHSAVKVLLLVPGLLQCISIAAKEHYPVAVSTYGLIDMHGAVHAGHFSVVPESAHLLLSSPL